MNVLYTNYFLQRRRKNCGVATVLVDNSAQIKLKYKEWKTILFKRRKGKQEHSFRRKSDEGTNEMEGNVRKYQKKSIDSKPDSACEVPCGYMLTEKTDRYRMIKSKRMKKLQKSQVRHPF